MATLEKIRSKSVLLLIIVGAALLAFIIGDFFTSGRTLFGTGTTVAKVGNQKIEIQEFQNRMEQANQQYQQTGQKVDQGMLQQQVLNSMMAEKLFREEMSKLGIKVTDKELSEMMLGSSSFYMDQIVRQQFGVESAATLHDMAFNPMKYGYDQATASQLQQLWVSLEKQMEQQLMEQKFMNLFTGTLTANELDAKALYDDGLATTNLAYVSKDYNSLNDEDYPVSQEEISKAWNEDKEKYAIPMQLRRISYITVPIEPSREDLVNAEQEVEAALTALNTMATTEGVADNNRFVVNRQKTVPSAIIDNQIKKFADTAKVGQAALVSRIGNDFRLAKVISKGHEVDSANVDLFVVNDNKAAVDSIVKGLNAGTLTMETLRNSDKVDGVEEAMDLPLLDPQVARYKEAFSTAQTGKYFTPDTLGTQPILVARVNRRNAPVEVYDLAVIDYTAEPSNKTINQLQANLQEYINKNANAADFTKNTSPEYPIMSDMISESSGRIGALPDSRNAVSWVMNAKKGNVSQIFGDETTGRFLVVAVNDIYDKYIPASDPQTQMDLTAKVRNDKKAQALIEQYSGKAQNLQGYAQAMDSKVDTASVNFGQHSLYYPLFGSPEVMAYIVTSEPGKVVGPIKSNTGIVVFDIIGTDTQGRPYNYDESAAMFNRTRGASILGENLAALLLGNKKMQNNLLKFYRD